MEKNFKGFALLELAIAISIMGLLMSFGLPMLTKLIRYSQIQTTKAHQEVVFKALGAYTLRHKRLPCPAIDITGTNPSSCKDNPQGIVPFTALNISKSYALDGFGRFFTYVVDPSFTTSGAPIHPDFPSQERSQEPSTYCSIMATSTPLSLQSVPVQDSNPITIILISHGSRGHGAMTQDFHQILLTTPSSLENENANSDFIFADVPFSTKEGEEFDHLVKWTSKDLFSTHYMHEFCKTRTIFQNYTGFSSIPED